jgi:hypothetical protein
MIRIINTDGVGRSTKIIDTDTGEEVTRGFNVGEVRITAADNVVEARLELQLVQLDVTPSAVSYAMRHPVTGKMTAVAAIQFADDTWHYFEKGSWIGDKP